MATFKDFAVNEVLTSADVDTYLMRNTIVPCASTADRDADLAGFEHEGMYADTADTDMLWRWNGTAWKETRPWIVRKASDETVNNSAVMQNDNELLFPGASNGSYIVQVVLFVQSGNSANDIKVGWSMPSGASWSGGVVAPDIAVANGTTTNIPGSGEWSAVLGASAATVSAGVSATASANTKIVVQAMIDLSSTAGTVNFQWAQNSAAANNTVVKARSWLRAERV